MIHSRIRRGTALGLQYRWWGILSMSLQKAVARAITRDEGEDLYEALLEPIPGTADLVIIWAASTTLVSGWQGRRRSYMRYAAVCSKKKWESMVLLSKTMIFKQKHYFTK